MDFKYWRTLVLRSGVKLGAIDDNWLHAQFVGGRSPAAVSQDIKNGMAPPKTYALPNPTMQRRTPMVLLVVLPLCILAFLVAAFSKSNLSPDVKRDIKVHWKILAPYAAVGELTNMSDQTLSNVRLTLPAAFTETQSHIETNREGLAISVPDHFTLEPGQSVIFQFFISGIDNQTVPSLDPPLPGHGIGLL